MLKNAEILFSATELGARPNENDSFVILLTRDE
jgi:hypothetical protein